MLLLLLVAGVFWYIQKPAPPEPNHPHEIHSPFNAETSQLSGKVLEFGSNERGDIDKILFENDGQKTWLHFPPHAAARIRELDLLNKKVSIEIGKREGPAGEDMPELVAISITNSTEKLLLHEIHPPRPSQGKEVNITGSTFIESPKNHGPEQSFLLSGKLILLPPHMAQTLFPILRNAKHILVKGYERDSLDGFVNISGQQVVRPYEITIDSATYLIQ
ncbi:hypothetical protein [Dyadobacter luticola]|nr:hypothetical protein [Dyadobacter luticola]